MIKPPRPKSLTLQKVIKPSAADAPSFAGIARKIGNPRLETALRELSEQIKRDVDLAGFFRKQFEVRDVVTQLKNKTRQFEIALNKLLVPPPDGVSMLLELPVDADFSSLDAARKAIKAIYSLCEDTLSIHPAKGGAPKKPGVVTCAAIVVEAWASVRGNRPGANNRTVQEICRDYWRACGGEPIGKEDDPNNWRRPMADALASQRGLRLRPYIQDEFRRCTE
jgi:hypothetical protein